MSKIKLSICIPTYNREKFLSDALNSILNQIDDYNKDKVEICISDNASEDNTKELINKYKENSQITIIYHRNEKNMGADFNYIKVIEIANGEYCWWLGSDDIIEKGGINTVLNNIEEYKGTLGGLMVNSNNYDFCLVNKLRQIPEIAFGKYKTNLIINNLNIFSEFIDYLGYISGQITNRKLFLNTIHNEGDLIQKWFNAYVHVYIILKIFLINKKFLWISNKLIGWRSGNDSFIEQSPNGIVKRMYLLVNGYRNILNYLLEPKYANKILSIISSIHIRGSILGIKNSKINYKTKLKTYLEITKEYYHLPMFWFKTMPIILCPEFVIRFIQMVWRKYFLIITK